MNQMESESQPSVQEEVFRSLLRTPHRQVDAVVDLHQRQLEADPNFYGKLAVYAVGQGHSSIRDVNEVFLAVLFASPYAEHREAAYVMLQDFPPYQVDRVARYVTGYDEIVKHHSWENPLPKSAKFGLTIEPAKYSPRHRDEKKRGKVISRATIKHGRKCKLRQRLLKSKLITAGATQITVDTKLFKHACLNKRCIRGVLASAVRNYLRLREREENRNQMEGACLRARNALRTLYAKTHTLPQHDENGWVNQYLFHGKVEEGSRLSAMRELKSCNDPTEQARLIMDNRLPVPQVVSVVRNITPTIWVALIEVMSPQELMQQLGAMKRAGAFNNVKIKSLIEGKLKKAKTTKSKRLDALKGAAAARSVEHLDRDIRKAVEDVTDSQLKRYGEIKARTALLIDKSGSMSQAIELGKQIGAAIAQSCKKDNPPRTYMFDYMPTPIEWRESDEDMTTKSAWDRKLAMFAARGGTAPDTVIRAMISKEVAVDQIVIVTDEGENCTGAFANSMKNYEAHFGFMPNIVIVRVRGNTGYPNDRIEKTLKASHINVDVLRCEEIDQIAIPNLLQLLSRKSVFDLVQDVLSITLPSRKTWDEEHNIISENALRKQAELSKV